MHLRLTLAAAAMFAVASWSTAAQATILTFDISESQLDPGVYGADGFPEGYGVIGQSTGFSSFFNPLSGYGSNVTGATGTHGNGTTAFSYGVDAEGYTPNVAVTYEPAGFISGGPVLWRDGYGDLNKVVYQGGAWSSLEIHLRPEAGYDVTLYGFDLGGYQGDFEIEGVEVFDGIPFPFLTPTNQIFADYGVTIPGPGSHKSYTFATPLTTSNRLVIRISTTGPLGEDQHDLIGIDNIRFGQAPSLTPIPEPASATLLALGLGSLGLVRARRRKLSA